MTILDQERMGLINADTMMGFSARPNPKSFDYVIVAIMTPEQTAVIGAYDTEQRAREIIADMYIAFEEGKLKYTMPIK